MSKVLIFSFYSRKKFGELFYWVMIVDLMPHPKGMLLESLALIGDEKMFFNQLFYIFS